MDRDGFRDHHDRFRYLVARENACRIEADPSVAEAGRRHLVRFSVPDPRQRDGVALWLRIFEKRPDEIVRCLLDRSPPTTQPTSPAPSKPLSSNSTRNA